MRRMVLSAVLAAVVLVASTPAGAREGDSPAGSYHPPVDAPVSDPFRPPPEPWAPGNRGLEYATAPATQVRAAAGGEVVFAGAVAGRLHVVILHPDGVRTSYSFLQSVAVHRGDRVEQGRPVGTSGERLHFGARLGDVYIDPAQLFDQGPPEVFLVPEEVRRPASEEGERKGLLDMLQGFGGELLQAGADGLEWAGESGTAAIDWARDNGGAAAEWIGETAVASEQWTADRLAAQWNNYRRDVLALLHYAGGANPFQVPGRVLATVPEWWNQRQNCTPWTVDNPTPGEGHLAVLVSGFDSTSTEGGVFSVNTMALGYHPAHVVRFSYRGGTTSENPFSHSDTTADIRQSARRLHDLLTRMAAEHPGTPIDVIAHSEGGLVARAMMAYEFDRSTSRPPVSGVVTLATPHEGTDLATFSTMWDETRWGNQVLTGIDAVWHGAMNRASLKGTAVRQMAEVSSFIRHLNRRPLPAGVPVTSIGSRGDYIVPANHTRLRGAQNVTVAELGANPHGSLPASDVAQREIALGLDGRAPSCQSLSDMLLDATVSESISWAEDSMAAGTLYWSERRSGPSRVHADDPGGDE